MNKALIACMLLIPIGGCSAAWTTIFERSVQSEPLDRGPQAISMTAERRIVLVRPRRIAHTDPIVCLESLPDVARAASAQSRGDLQNGAAAGTTAARISFEDQFSTSLLQTFQRTQLADVSRNLAWQICLAYANGAITEIQYHTLLELIIQRSFHVLGTPPVVTTAARSPSGTGTAAAQSSPGQIVNNVTVAPSVPR